MTSVVNFHINHFNIIIVIYYLLSVVITNAEMSIDSGSHAIVNTPIPATWSWSTNVTDRDRQTDRQTDRQKTLQCIVW